MKSWNGRNPKAIVLFFLSSYREDAEGNWLAFEEFKQIRKFKYFYLMEQINEDYKKGFLDDGLSRVFRMAEDDSINR